MSTAIVWFHSSDLRLHDHQPFATANAFTADRCKPHAQSKNSTPKLNEITNVLPVFVFDPQFLGVGRSRLAGFQKSGPRRAQFLIEAVEDLRTQLRAKGSDLVIRVGDPSVVLPGLAEQCKASVCYSFSEWASEELDVETSTAKGLARVNCQLRLCFGGTLVHLDDLPFDLHDFFGRQPPPTFSSFRTFVEKNWTVRSWKTHSIPQKPGTKLRQLPPSVDVGDLPQLSQLGYEAEQIMIANLPLSLSSSSASDALGTGSPLTQDARSVLSFKGGETVALQRLQHYVWLSDSLRSYKETRNGLIGADYSSKFSPWLAHGCISPLRIYDDVQLYEHQRVKNESTYWLIFECVPLAPSKPAFLTACAKQTQDSVARLFSLLHDCL